MAGAQQAGPAHIGIKTYGVGEPGVEEGRHMTYNDLVLRITEYLEKGGLWNPEVMDHMKVRDLLMDCRAALRSAAPSPAPSTDRAGVAASRDAGTPMRKSPDTQLPYCPNCQPSTPDPRGMMLSDARKQREHELIMANGPRPCTHEPRPHEETIWYCDTCWGKRKAPSANAIEVIRKCLDREKTRIGPGRQNAVTELLRDLIDLIILEDARSAVKPIVDEVRLAEDRQRGLKT